MKIKEGGGMDIQKLTKEQAVIISGFTGILCGEFSDFHADVEKRLGRGVQTFEFGFKEFATEVKKLYEADFIEMGTVDKEQAKAQAVPEGYILIPKKMPDEVNDHLWDFMTDNFVCTNDYGDSFMACDDFNLDKFYAELVKAQEPAND